MRKKWIVIIVICVLLLAVTGLTFYRGSKMDPELAAVGYTGGAQTENESPVDEETEAEKEAREDAEREAREEAERKAREEAEEEAREKAEEEAMKKAEETEYDESESEDLTAF